MRRSWIGVLLIMPFIVACGEEGGGGDGSAPEPEPALRPLAKAEGWREGLIDSLPGDQPYALVEIAFDRDTADRAWAENAPADLEPRTGSPEEAGRYGELDQVDFDTHAVVIWSSGESGSCPGWLADISTDEAGTVSLTTDQRPDDACTDDFHPYRMVLSVDRDALPEPGSLPTTDVSVDGRPLPDVSLVRTYPS